ncbi:YjeF N-terminal domain-containing protein [Paraphysoderma sedebokerense]|nr:YjeF N-terminal domain-containing protein [Paraphysoderma sedebokerense]
MDFVGLTVKLVCNNGTLYHGKVQHIDQQTHTLTLNNATEVKPNGLKQTLAICYVRGSDIKELDIVSSKKASSARPTSSPQSQLESTLTHPAHKPSLERKPSLGPAAPSPKNIPPPSQLVMDDGNIERNQLPPDPAIVSFSMTPHPVPAPTVSSERPPITSFKQPRVLYYTDLYCLQVVTEENYTTTTDDEYYHRNGKPKRQNRARRKNQYDSSPEKRTRNGRRLRDGSEWASEDVTGAEYGQEFDFQGNLGLFNKEKIWDEIRSQDATAPETLLVNLNRRNNQYQPQPKLHHTENVLSPHARPPTSFTADVPAPLPTSTVTIPMGSRQSSSRLSGQSIHSTHSSKSAKLRKQRSKQKNVDSDDESDTDELDEYAEGEAGKTRERMAKIGKHHSHPHSHPHSHRSSYSAGGKSRNNSIIEIENGLTSVSLNTSNAGIGAGLSVSNDDVMGALGSRPLQSPPPRGEIGYRTLTGVTVECATAVQMLEVERMAATETGPSEEQMIENAGRGIAMMTIQALGGGRRMSHRNHNSPPTVILLCGNNKHGAYTLAAGRHLSNRGIEVIACIVGDSVVSATEIGMGVGVGIGVSPIGREDVLIKNVQLQKRYLRSAGGLTVSYTDLPIPSSQPVDLIIDGLLGYQYSIRDLPSANDQQVVTELITYANRNKAPILSIDVPSGVDGTTGYITSPPIYIVPKWTLCLGIPKSGLISRNVTGELFLTDLGIPNSLWRRVGVREWENGVWEGAWLVGLEYV